MKILVFGHPRSGSSLTVHTLMNHFNLKGLGDTLRVGEIFAETDLKDYQSKIDLMTRSENIIVKIINKEIDLRELDLSIFDKIYICERRNRIDAMLSLYAAEQSKAELWQNLESFEFTVKKSYLIRWSLYMRYFDESKEVIQQSSVPSILLYYEDIVRDPALILQGLDYDPVDFERNYLNLPIGKSKFDYSKDCLNYEEVCRWAGLKS